MREEIFENVDHTIKIVLNMIGVEESLKNHYHMYQDNLIRRIKLEDYNVELEIWELTLGSKVIEYLVCLVLKKEKYKRYPIKKIKADKADEFVHKMEQIIDLLRLDNCKMIIEYE